MGRWTRIAAMTMLALVVLVSPTGCLSGSDASNVSASWQASSSGKPVFYYFGTPS